MPHRRQVAPGSFHDRLDRLVEQFVESARPAPQRAANEAKSRKRKRRKADFRTINQLLFEAAKR